MRRNTLAIAMGVALVGALTTGPVRAQSLDVAGYLDLRVADGPDETGWLDGGLGKTRFGAGDDAWSGGGALTGTFQVTPALLASATVQYVPELDKPFDLLEGYLRYRPVSITPNRWSFKAGAFLPPISLEHDGVGWSTTRTLTPSALNTWVGEELRIFGAELQLEHRGQHGTLDARAALFFKNDPAGELLASRGWAMGDIATGVDGNLREPDTLAVLVGAPVPMRFRPFVEMDDDPGAYASLGWRPSSQTHVTALYYDNHADLHEEVDYAGREVYAWRTHFWNLGAERRLGEWALLAQAMHGHTLIEATPVLVLNTEFNAGYLMFAREEGDWRPALRVDLFHARQRPEELGALGSEHGNAITAALNWRPRENLRFPGEVLRIDSTRSQRELAGEAAQQVDMQVQLGMRVFF